MNKKIIKKITISLLLILVVFASLATYYNKLVVEDEKNYKRYLGNNQFDTTLVDPSDPNNPLEEFVSMTTLYDIIKDAIEDAENLTEEEKDQVDAEIVQAINLAVGSKKVSISNASELFRFGNAQSINFDKQAGVNTYIYRHTIERVLELDYILLDDIDYSTMKAEKFVPIGTDINVQLGDGQNPIVEKFEFEGTFDGNGFEIRNLYLAEYPYISTTFSDDNSSITISTIQHYSMFSVIGKNGTVKNLILRNPRYELIVVDGSSGIFQFSTLAGENNGSIFNVGVIDKRVNANEDDNSGITFTMLDATTQLATAAGFVHTNNGTVKNSYYVSKNIISPVSLFRFSEVAPFVHTNTITNGITSSGYENIAEIYPVDNEFPEIESYNSTQIKNGDANINVTIENELSWHFYPDDGYPQLIGLEYSNGVYHIKSDRDFIAFSKLISLSSQENGKPFDEHTYVLDKNINMANYKGYKTPSKEFKGVLKGLEDTTGIGPGNSNHYIYNLNISNPHIVGNSYYLGLFSVLSGTVQNINLYNNQITIKSSKNDYGKVFYVGAVAGELRNTNVIIDGETKIGTLKNIISNSTIDLGTEAIGLTYAGGLVGYASGKLTYVANLGSVNGGIHNFDSKPINANYYVGGLVGTNSGDIEISYSINKGDITAVGSTNDEYIVQDTVNTYTGGIIGEVNNIKQDTSSLVYLTNEGTIDGSKFEGSSNKVHQFVGGIFGSVKGFGFTLVKSKDIYNGKLENVGVIKGQFVNSNTYLYAAGIGVANTNQLLAKISYLVNNSDFMIDNFNYQTHNTNLFYAATVIDNSDQGIELSRAYNDKDFTFGPSYFEKDSELSNPNSIKISPFFTSTKEASSKLLYVENRGKLTVGSKTQDVIVEVLLKASNITQATKIDYQNVINLGDVEVLRLNNKNDSIYISGVAWILSYISRPYTMTNVVNEGYIYTAGIKGDTAVNGSVTGQSFTHREFYANLDVRNLYVSGIVNINVGEIKNSFNIGNISSKYDSNILDIKGTANTFVGGVATFNYNLIQDVANSGLIEYTNSNTSSVSYFAATTDTNQNNNSTFGGISISYTGGLVLGGIVGAFGDVQGTELIGYASNFIDNEKPVAKVIDIANNGDIYGKAKEYVRSGGILGIALSVELASGTFENRSEKDQIKAGPFTKAEIGSEDPVGKSLLSNGLNFGNIYAITSTIGDYGTKFGIGSGDQDANARRPGINACAGGVIAYGLTEMVRMLNHGVVSSTDVAGGIIGATYILGGTSQATTPITTVKINTAVHYGKIKAIKQSSYGMFSYEVEENFEDEDKYYEDGNTSFLFAGMGSHDPAMYQNGRRGFGGVFGRLQRGNFGTMESTEFKNIMNMDPNIDMVGRVDSNMHRSLVYYRFYTGLETYYSAKTNDTTPNALVGWLTQKNETYKFTNASVRFTIQRNGTNNYYVSKMEYISGVVVREIHGNKIAMRPKRTDTSSEAYSFERTVTGVFYQGSYFYSNNSRTNRIANFGIDTSEINTRGNFPQVVVKNNYTRDVTVFYENTTNTSNPSSSAVLKYPVPKVTEVESDLSGLYIFDSKFPLKSHNKSEYIYDVNVDALASRFKVGGTNAKPNGMYVLTSSTGSLDGATLPTNIKMDNLLRLKEEDFKYIDLYNVKDEEKLKTDDYRTKLKQSYENMFQLSYNKNSDILPEDEMAQTLIGELILYDPYGNSPILTRGVIDYNTSPKTITYTLSNSAFSQDNFYYEVKENILSHNAIIARSNINLNELTSFQTAYDNRVNGVLKSDSPFKFSYSGSVSSGNSTSFPLKVYSEISIMDEDIFTENKYVETYNVIIVRSSTDITTNATITLNPDTSNVITRTADNIAANYTVGTTDTLLPNGKIEVSFTGSNGTVNSLIPLNHMMKVHKVSLVERVNGVDTEVDIDPSYYWTTIIPKASNDRFGFTVEFDDLLKKGTYKIYYSYYENGALRSISVDKRDSEYYDILDVSYEHFSSDLEGLITTFERTSAKHITTYIEFGYIIDGVSLEQEGVLASSFSIEAFYQSNNEPYDGENGEIAYIDDIYYKLYLSNKEVIKIKIAPFARLLGATIKYKYTTSGKVQYILDYNIKNEKNVVDTITHEIFEREISDMQVYLDDNLQTSNNFTVTREASLSTISIDFRFIYSSLYSKVRFNVYDESEDLYEYLETEIYEGSHIDMFILYITGLLDKGEKVYKFELEREEANGEKPAIYYELGELRIEKLEGTSAYLLDIKFTLDDSEIIFEYPIIQATNSNGEIDRTYTPRIYADGIDYVNTIESNVRYFRIDGKVSDMIILEDYSPRFTLPHGAKIERFDPISNKYVSDLKANFADGEDEEEKIVEYKVTSENNQQVVIYYITAKDTTKNLILKFKIFFELNGQLFDAFDNQSLVKNKFVLISFKNFELTDKFPTTGPTVAGFPVINEGNILGVNSQSSLYYYTSADQSITYRFGRNSRGAYNFNIITPIYSGVKTDYLTPGERFKYDIYMMPRGESNWKTNEYKLPLMSDFAEDYSGLYYYVYSTSPNVITRELAIVIKAQTNDKKWGLYDEYTSWD